MTFICGAYISEAHFVINRAWALHHNLSGHIFVVPWFPSKSGLIHKIIVKIIVNPGNSVHFGILYGSPGEQCTFWDPLWVSRGQVFHF
jgi:hypothetical protein